MKKQTKKLSLERFNIARLTVDKRYIFGGGLTEETNQTCTCTETRTCTTEPQGNSSLGCVQVSATCPSQQHYTTTN